LLVSCFGFGKCLRDLYLGVEFDIGFGVDMCIDFGMGFVFDMCVGFGVGLGLGICFGV
jgi:hypothetical protein